MAHNTSPTLDKQICTNYVDFGKFQDRFWLFFDEKLLQLLGYQTRSVQERQHNAEFRLRQNFTMEEADFNKFFRQRNQLVVAADNFLREQYFASVLQSTLSKDMVEQLKLVHKVINVVDRPIRRICVTLLRYKVDNPKTSYAQVCPFGRKKEEQKIQQFVYVNYKVDEFVYLLDVMNSVYDKVIANQRICKVL